MKAVRRGKFCTLVTSAGGPVLAELYGCVVVREAHASGGKTYATLDVSVARGRGVGVLRSVDARVRREAAPEFSPLRPDGTLVVKIPDHVRCESREGRAAPRFEPARGQALDVVLKLGAYGSFGYCWLAARMKPHSPGDYTCYDDDGGGGEAGPAAALSRFFPGVLHAPPTLAGTPSLDGPPRVAH